MKATLDLPLITDPGTMARYCSGGVAVVGRSIERTVGMSLPDFAHTQFFTKLGIPRSAWRWNYTLNNTNREYSQIHIRPRDMLKIGMLYTNGGQWAGTQVLSRTWIDASLAEQSSIDGTAYGYFWWRPWLNVSTPTGDRRVTMNAAQGNGGQKIYLVPSLDLVAVFTGGDYNSGGSPPNRIMSQVILPPLLKAREGPRCTVGQRAPPCSAIRYGSASIEERCESGGHGFERRTKARVRREVRCHAWVVEQRVESTQDLHIEGTAVTLLAAGTRGDMDGNVLQNKSRDGDLGHDIDAAPNAIRPNAARDVFADLRQGRKKTGSSSRTRHSRSSLRPLRRR